MDSSSDNNIQPGSSGSKHSGNHSSRHSHHSHHRHSSRRDKTPVKQYKNIKRHRLEDEPKRQHLQKIETFFIKNILSIFTVIFLAGAIWFGIGTWKSVESSSVISYEKSKNIEQSIINKILSLRSSLFAPEKLKPTTNTVNTSFIFILGFSLVFILAAMSLSIRQKKIMLKTISFLAWILLSSWLMIKFFITLDSAVFYISVILLFIFSGLFFISGFVDSYIGRSKWKYKIEYWFILINSLFYFFIMIVILYKSGYKNYLSVFVFLLSSVHLIAIYYMDKKNLTYNKVPYLISTLIITCSFLPLILRISPAIVFLAPLSVFLILFSKYSRNQASVLFSLGAMAIMVIIYLYQWAFSFIPDIFVRDDIQNKAMFYKGLVSSVFILPAFAINNSLLKRLAISFSHKWLSKGKYLKYIKGALLLVIYLFLYWIFNYILISIFENENLDLLIWFSFNCLYFIFYIPYLARQRSSFLRLIIILSIISSLAYLTIIHFNIIQLRNLYLEALGMKIFPFLFHYIPVALLAGMLFTLLKYFKRAFAGKKTLIKGFWMFFYFLSVFILLSEFNHLAILYGVHKGMGIDEIIDNNRKIPYSLLLLLSFFVVLISGFIVKSRFLRLFSLIILTAVLIKILAYDMITMQTQSKMILFLILGLFLLGISLLYPKIKQLFFQKDSPQSQNNYSGIKKHRRQ
jgi:hypothetical protein